MPGVGLQELIIIMVIALIIFGPGKIPEISGAIGKAIRNFKKSVDEPAKVPEQKENKR
jgi:sec-independent protein translocase protein TatA